MPAPGPAPSPILQTATFGAGCFWCTEAVFRLLRGVETVVSGYCGGQTPLPTYERICRGDTGHAEAVQIRFDPDVVSFVDLLEAFFSSHDPTTLNRQGVDVGTQYRSVIFYHDESQRETAERCVRELDAARVLSAPVVTQIVPAAEFYPAEAYHQNYYQDNPRQSYCAFVVRPKVEKIRQHFAAKLKP